MSQELLALMATAIAKGDWTSVADIANLIGAGETAAPKKTASRKSPISSAGSEVSGGNSTFVNKFVDDKTLEKTHIASDRKLLKGVKPTTRRPPSGNKPAEVFCPKCNKPHMVSSSLVAIRRETDSGIVCPSCLRSPRR